MKKTKKVIKKVSKPKKVKLAVVKKAKKPIVKIKNEPLEDVNIIQPISNNSTTFVAENEQYWQNRVISDDRRDWADVSLNWVEDYWNSQNHPHRDQLMNELSKLEFDSLLEIGCNAGANIARIRKFVSDDKLAGFDINEDAINFAKEKLPAVDFKVGNMVDGLPYAEKSFDVALEDAALIYIDPKNIKKVLEEFKRVAKKYIVICDWDSDEVKGEIKDHHWCYNYQKLLEKMGYKVSKVKIEKWETPSGNWARNGFIFVAAHR